MFSFLWNDDFSSIQTAIASGDVAEFLSALEKQFKDEWPEQKGSVLKKISMYGENTVLHKAALMKKGALDIVKYICETSPFLMGRSNVKGETVWHVAVKDRSCAVFNILNDQRDYVMTNKLRITGDSYCDEGVTIGAVGGYDDLSLRASSHLTGNTALHEALLSGNREAAAKIFLADMDLCYKLNKERKSPLYMALEMKEVEIFENMITFAIHTPEGLDKIGQGKSLVRAAISRKQKDFLKTMWDLEPLLFQLTDEDELYDYDDDEVDSPLSYTPEVPEDQSEARSIGPFKVNYDALLALKNNDEEMPAHDALLRGSSHLELQLQYSKAVSRVKEIIKNLKCLFPLRASRKQSDEYLIDLLPMLSILVFFFSFILTSIPNLYVQPLYGLNIFLLYTTCPGTLFFYLVQISGYTGLSTKLQTWYFAIVASVTGVVITILINLLITKILYIAAVTTLVLIPSLLFLKLFITELVKGVKENRRARNSLAKSSQGYSGKIRPKDRAGLKSSSIYEQERARLAYSKRRQPRIKVRN